MEGCCISIPWPNVNEGIDICFFFTKGFIVRTQTLIEFIFLCVFSPFLFRGFVSGGNVDVEKSFSIFSLPFSFRIQIKYSMKVHSHFLILLLLFLSFSVFAVVAAPAAAAAQSN